MIGNSKHICDGRKIIRRIGMIMSNNKNECNSNAAAAVTADVDDDECIHVTALSIYIGYSLRLQPTILEYGLKSH